MTVQLWGWNQNSGDDPPFAQHRDQSSYTVSGTQASLSIPQLDLWSYRIAADWHHGLTVETLPGPKAARWRGSCGTYRGRPR